MIATITLVNIAFEGEKRPNISLHPTRLRREEIGRSEMYTSEASREDGIAAVKRVAPIAPIEDTIKFETQANGTQVTQTVQGEPGGFFKIAEGLVSKQIEKQIGTDFDALKLQLEAG